MLPIQSYPASVINKNSSKQTKDQVNRGRVWNAKYVFNADFLISASDIRKCVNFWYQKIIFCYQKMPCFSDIRNCFLISKIIIFISENATIFWYQKLFLISENRISDIRRTFSDIRKSALKSYLAFHSRDKMATILRTAFEVYFRDKMFRFRFKLHLSFSPMI